MSRRLVNSTEFLVVAACLVLCGCDSAEQTVEDSSTPQVSTTGTAGTSTVSTTPPADNRPEFSLGGSRNDYVNTAILDDIPIYPGATLMASVVSEDNGTALRNYRTLDAAAPAEEWYRNALTDAGWTVGETETDPVFGDNKMTATMGDRTLTVEIDDRTRLGQEGTVIRLSHAVP